MTTDQVTLLTQGTENSFSAKKKASAVFVGLTATYDTAWHRGLTCKLLCTLPDRHIVSFVMELVRNRSFTLTTGNGPQSRSLRLKNGIPQESVLFNIYHSTPMICLSKSPGSLFTQTTWPSCSRQKTGSLCRELSHRTWQPYHRTYRNRS